MKKKIVRKALTCIVILLLFSISIIVSASSSFDDVDKVGNESMISGPVLKADIKQWIGWFMLQFSVENIGDETAHNVEMSDVSFEGQVIYNSRSHLVAEMLEPGQKSYSATGIYIGLGTFIANLTVSCDEGVSDTTSANGLAFGLLCFIP